MPWSIYAITLLLSTIAEVVAANSGQVVPLLGICAFYFTMRYGAQRSLPGVVLVAAMVDACWMHRFPSQILLVLVVAGLSSAWKPYGDLNSGLSLCLSGCCIGIISWLLRLFGALISSSHWPSWSAVLLPLVTQLFLAMLLTLVLSLALNRMLRKSITWFSADDEGDD